MNDSVRPLPGDVVPDAIDQPFWDACARRQLLVYRCGRCGRCLWPAGSCPTDGMADMSWVPATGNARLHTWTVIHQQYSRSFTDTPVVVAVVELEEGTLIHTNIKDCAPADLRAGMPLRVGFDTTGPLALPVFAPAGGA